MLYVLRNRRHGGGAGQREGLAKRKCILPRPLSVNPHQLAMEAALVSGKASPKESVSFPDLCQ